MHFNKNILHKIVTILLRLFAHYTKSGLSSNEQKNKFLLSLVTYTRQFHKIICYCIELLCHNHLQNTAIQTSQELQQKLVLQSCQKLTTKKHMSIYCRNYYYNKSNSGHRTKNQHIKHQDNQNHKPLFKVFESTSIIY